MKNANHATCTCCGVEITAPQFYKGKAYGYTCIKKIAPEFKRTSKAKSGIWVKPNSVVIKQVEGRALWNVVVEVQGIKFNIGNAYSDNGNNRYFQGGLLLLSHPQHGHTFNGIESYLNESSGKVEKLIFRDVVLWEA